MKLHLPVKLRSAVLSCMAVLATIGTTVVTGTLAGGAFALVVSSAVAADVIEIPADDTTYQGKTTTITGADSSLTVTGTGKLGTTYDYGTIIAEGGAVVSLTPYPTSSSDSVNSVGTEKKLTIATALTLQNGSELDCNATSFYLTEPLTIVGNGNKMDIHWSKSYDFAKLVGGEDAGLEIALSKHDWANYSLVRVLDTASTYEGKISLSNAGSAQMALLGGGTETFAAADINLGTDTKLLLGNATVKVGSLEGSGSIELCPQDYVPTSEMTVPTAAQIVVVDGSDKTFSGSFGAGVSLNLTGGSLTLQGQTLDASRLSVAQDATLTLSGVTLDGTSLQGEGNYAFSGNITLTGDFGEIQNGTVLFAGSNVTAADGTVFTLSKVGWDTSAAYVDGKVVVVSNTVTKLAFATETIMDVSYDILYTKSLGATISYNDETNEYTAQYVSGDGKTYSISGGAQTDNGLVVVGADAIGAMPEAGMTLKVTSGTYQGLSFTRVNDSTKGTLGTAEEKAQLTLNILGDASVSNFIDGGQGLLGWSDRTSAIVFNSDITANVNTSGSVAWINLTGESNYLNSMSVNGDLTATILSGTIGADTAGERASLASGAKGMVINGNSTFTIGKVGTTGPKIEGSIVGGIVQRDGGATGSMTGDVVININSGSIAGNVYATGSKAALNGNYTVNYSGGTLGGQIAVSAGGTVTGTKTLNICGTGALDTTKFAYSSFDVVTVGENAVLTLIGDSTKSSFDLTNNGTVKLSGDVTLGCLNLNSGTVDFAGVTSVAVDVTGITPVSDPGEDGSLTDQYVLLSGGNYTNIAGSSWLTDGLAYNEAEQKLIYTLTATAAQADSWDANWGATGLQGAPIVSDLTGVDTITETTYLPTSYTAANGDTQIRVTGGGGSGVNLYGGRLDSAFSGNSWICVEGGTWGTVVGGTYSDAAQANFTGSSHILITGNSTVDHVYGGIHADAGSPVMTGNTYVSIEEGSNIKGWVAGGNVSWHVETTTLSGNTNVWIYEVLTGEMAPSNQDGPATNLTAVIGGNAWLRNSYATSILDGNTNVNVQLGADAAQGVDSPTFGKLIVGGSLIGREESNPSKATVTGDTNVTIDTTGSKKTIVFSKDVIGAGLLVGPSGDVTYEQMGESNLSIKGASEYKGRVILGCRVGTGMTATVAGTSTLTVDGGTFSDLVIGGMYAFGGTSSLSSGDIVMNLNGGTYSGAIIGGHCVMENDATAITKSTTGDVTINIGANAKVDGAIYGGTVLQRTSGASNVLTQGNININLATGASINSDIYAAGGDYENKAATAALTTESTRVAIADGVNLKDGITISGGYIGMGNSAGSVVSENRTLALTGTGTYDLSKVTLKDFDTVEVTDAAASVNMGVSLSSAGIINKTGAGTYQLMEGDQAGDLAILEGTLKLSSAATMTSLTVSKGATLDATSGAVSTDLTLGEGSTLKLGSSALNLGTDKTLTLGSDLTLDVTGVDASDSVELVSGLASVMLGTTSMETGKWMSASDYFSSVVLGGTSISDALLKLEGNTLVVTDAKNAALYWEGASNGTWGGQNWAATPGGTDLGSFLSGTQVFFESNTQQEVVRVDQAATAYDITVNGDYRFADAGGSLAVSNTLNVGSAGKADFGVAVDLSEATAKVENGGELTLTGETSIKDLQNDGSTQVNGNLSIGAATSGAGSLGVAGDLTLTGDTNSFGSLNVTGSVNSTGTINLTGAVNTASSIGTLSGASITSTNVHNLTLTGASSTMSNLSLAEGSTLTLASGAALTVDSVSGGRIDVTLADGLNATSSQLTLGGLTSGATINFTDATKDTFDTLFAAGASSVVLAQLTAGAQIDGSLLLDGQTSLATSDGNLYKVVVGTNSIYVYYAHSGLIWDSAGASESWQLAGAWNGDSAAPTAGDNVVFNGQGSDTVVLGNGAVANSVYIESEQGDKIYTFTDGDLTADGTIHVTSGTLAIADDASVKADGVEVTTGNLTVMGSLDAGQMTANAVTLDGSGSLTLGDGSNVDQVIAGASASGTSLNVSDGSVTVGTAEVDRVTVAGGAVLGAGSLTVEGVSVGNGSTLNADSLTLTGTSSTNAGSINAGTLSVLTGGNNLGALTTDNLSFSDVGEAGATDAVLTVSSIASVTSGQGIALDFSGLNVSRDGSYYLVSCMYGTDATFALTQEAVNYLSTLRFKARLDTASDGSSVKLVLSTLGEMVWRTALDTDETGSYTIPLSGDDMYRGLEPIQYVVVNGDKTLDYTQADPSSALVSSLGAVVRNMSGVAGYTLTFVGDGMADDLVTFINDEGDSVGAHTIAGQNITLQVGADASDLAALVDKGILKGTPQNHALTVGGVTLEASRLEVSDAEGVKFTTGTLDGDEQSVISGTIHINGAGGEYAGSGENATIVLEQGAGQIFTNGSGITLTGSAGVAGVEGATLGGLATTGADVVLMAPAEGDPIVPVNLETSSSMTGGMLEVTVDEENVLAGKGGDNAIFSGESISLQGTHLVLNSNGSSQSMVAEVDLSKTDGFVITQLHEDVRSTASGVSVTFNGGLLGKYFGNATVQGNQIVASRNTSYYVSAAASTPNGSAGLALADGALVAFNPQAGTNSATHPDLAGVLNSLDAAIAAGDRAGADRLGAIFAGAEAAGMGMAFSNDMDRQLRAIRNRTTTMGVGDEYVNPEMPYFNAWINAEGDYQQVKRDGTTPGYSLSSWGGTLGADVDFTPHFTAGLAVTAMYGDYQSESNGMAEGDLDSYYVTLFGRYSGNSAWVHTFVASVGMADASLKRTVTHANGSYTAEGDTTGMGFGLLYELGYTIALNEEATTCLQPVLNLSYVHTTLDGYRESGSDAALNFGNQKMDTFTVGLGARLQTLVGENIYNRTSMFESRALLKFTTGDRSSSMHTALASLPSMKSRVESEEQGAIGVELGAGLSVPLGADSGTLFIDASLEAYTSYTNVNATVGWRINF